MIKSMTGFASGKGAHGVWQWTWDLRSVNGRGLDLRLRVPDWIDGLEAALRAELGKAVARGNVTLNLRVTRGAETGTPALNADAVRAALAAMAQVETLAMEEGATLAPSRAADILSLRGVMDVAAAEEDTAPLKAALIAEAPDLIGAFVAMRAEEGRALDAVLRGQIDEIAELTDAADGLKDQRDAALEEGLRAALARVLDNAEGADPQRVAQELALIAVKTDIAEEIDRLRAHVAAARDLLDADAPVGRKLDFLTQEFNREANTLCSKAQFGPLTTIGLALKAAIDRMREQVQNVE